MSVGVPDISELTRRPILQTLASKSSWVRVDFYKNGSVTREEIYRTMELLAITYNGWTDRLDPSESLSSIT